MSPTQYIQRYYRENRERIIRRTKEYNRENKEKKKAYFKDYVSRPDKREARERYNKKYVQRPEVKKADKRRKQEKKDWYRKYHLEYYYMHKNRINAKRKNLILRERNDD